MGKKLIIKGADFSANGFQNYQFYFKSETSTNLQLLLNGDKTQHTDAERQVGDGYISPLAVQANIEKGWNPPTKNLRSLLALQDNIQSIDAVIDSDYLIDSAFLKCSATSIKISGTAPKSLELACFGVNNCTVDLSNLKINDGVNLYGFMGADTTTSVLINYENIEPFSAGDDPYSLSYSLRFAAAEVLNIPFLTFFHACTAAFSCSGCTTVKFPNLEGFQDDDTKSPFSNLPYINRVEVPKLSQVGKLGLITALNRTGKNFTETTPGILTTS